MVTSSPRAFSATKPSSRTKRNIRVLSRNTEPTISRQSRSRATPMMRCIRIGAQSDGRAGRCER